MHPASRAILICAALTGVAACGGCDVVPGSLLDPRGPVALAQNRHLIAIVLWLSIVVVPVAVMTPVIAWRYRQGNPSSAYRPDWDFSWPLEIVCWGVPIVIVSVLSVRLWTQTIALDPYRPLGVVPPTEVQVVALNWKWLFIYPGEQIATVNELVFPADRPVHLTITSDVAMQSFMIPALGGQIYAMAGMRTRLNLRAARAGTFRGENMQYNGSGFANAGFQAKAVTEQDYGAWVASVRSGGGGLDAGAYGRIARPSVPDAPQTFGSVTPGLFDKIVTKYQAEQ